MIKDIKTITKNNKWTKKKKKTNNTTTKMTNFPSNDLYIYIALGNNELQFTANISSSKRR